MLHLKASTLQTYLLISLICAFGSACFGQSIAPGNDSLYYRNPENFIAKKVLDGNIVMLGDVTHGDVDSYNSLLKVLYALSDEISSSQVEPVKLTLILEKSRNDAQMLNDFVSGGSLERLIEGFDPFKCYTEMEYYSNLRKFFASTSEKRNLIIEFKGFEPMDSNPSPEMIKYSPWQLDSAFLVRDSILSLRVIDFISESPDSKIIIYYGDGHLQTGLKPKLTIYDTHGKCFGFYMAEYLKRHFGNEKVATFGQRRLNPDFFNGTEFSEFEHSNIVAQGRNIDTAKLPYPQNYDYCIFWNTFHEYSLPSEFSFVFSRRNVDKNIEFFKTCSQYKGNEQAEIYVKTRLFYFNFLTCSSFKTSEDALTSGFSNSYNGMEILKSDCFKNKIYEVYAHSKSKKLLEVLGFREKDIEIGSTTDTLKRFNDIWDANLQQMIFLNQIGVMWIGYPDEQKTAKEFLKLYSAIDSDDPVEYFEWFRNNKK